MKRSSVAAVLGAFSFITGAAFAEDWKKGETALFTFEIPANWVQVEAAWQQDTLEGRWKWQSPNRNWRFIVDIESLPKDQVEITHVNLNDGTLEGFRHKRLPAFSVQYHPESAPGPHDSQYLFDHFITEMDGFHA